MPVWPPSSTIWSRSRDALNSGNTSTVSAAQTGALQPVRISWLEQSPTTAAFKPASKRARLSRRIAKLTSVDQLISSETSADLPATIVKLNQTQTAYQAALQSASNIAMRLSLLDYIK